MRLPFAKTSLSGFVLLIAGVGYLAESLVANLLFIETPLSDGGMMVIRGAADSMVVGLLLVIYASLRRRGRDVEEAYRLGYDVGFENGYRLGRSADAPMVRAAMNSGDKVVPITASRGSTG